DSGGTSSQETTVVGIVDVDDRRGYLRTAGYRRSPGDIPLTPAQIRQYGLRKGDLIEGTVAARERGDDSATRNESNGAGPDGRASGNGTRNRQRNRDSGGSGLTGVTAINGLPPDDARNRPHFDDLTPVYPNERFRLEDGDPSPAARIIDLVSPIGKGQRGLIVAPPKAGKTTVLKPIAPAIAAAYPEGHRMRVLVGERPEAVTALRRSVRGAALRPAAGGSGAGRGAGRGACQPARRTRPGGGRNAGPAPRPRPALQPARARQQPHPHRRRRGLRAAAASPVPRRGALPGR